MDIARKRIEIYGIYYFDWQDKVQKAILFETFGEALAADEILYEKGDNLFDPAVQQLVLDKEWKPEDFDICEIIRKAGIWDGDIREKTCKNCVNDNSNIKESCLGEVEFEEWKDEYLDETKYKRPPSCLPDLYIVYSCKYPHVFSKDSYTNSSYALQYNTNESIGNLAIFTDYQQAQFARTAVDTLENQGLLLAESFEEILREYNSIRIITLDDVDFLEEITTYTTNANSFYFAPLYPEYGIIRTIGEEGFGVCQ